MDYLCQLEKKKSSVIWNKDSREDGDIAEWMGGVWIIWKKEVRDVKFEVENEKFRETEEETKKGFVEE